MIVFDEIHFHNVGKLSLIWDFVMNNPEKIHKSSKQRH